ncbi:uncharacterized protein MONBRDRAFT_39071 [Monosiga brevicollis MX1]|uniref:DNA primase n=1 Tax=Monosiga brevicollis TaxID=81824 RepID=A9VC12_MONBE|nr:uncharacterized protein MONBRDRAFT_39071 [Monosiga brevicollis MX1]EDQ84899.1 predicted protein [Monosiga brevicollis MX1]|eukprot:XP_001750240.1 hypothetical protein [Monosiga brevicollis MX1]
MEGVVERKLKQLREKLNEFGYTQPLGVESLPLAERLFADLLHTTASLKRIKEQAPDRTAGSSETQAQTTRSHDPLAIEAYQADNARLVKEVNHLHGEVIRRKDAADAQIKKLKHHATQLGNENQDLRFLNTQYAHRIRVLERETDAQKARLDELLAKNMEAAVTLQDEEQRRIPTRRQRMDMSHLLPEVTMSAENEHPSRPAVPQTRLDLDDATAREIERLEDVIRQLKRDSQAGETRIEAMQGQIDRRDAEIQRLNGLLEGGRPLPALRAETALKREARQQAHLETQVEFLQTSNKALQDELVTMVSTNDDNAARIAELEADNAKLAQELAHIQQLAKQVETERVASSAAVNRQLTRERDRLHRQHETLKEKLRHASELQSDVKRVHAENQHLLRALQDAETEMGRLQEDVEKLLDDNDYLDTRVRQLAQFNWSLQKELRQHGASDTTFRDLARAAEEAHPQPRSRQPRVRFAEGSRSPHPAGTSPDRAQTTESAAASTHPSTPSKQAIEEQQALQAKIADLNEALERLEAQAAAGDSAKVTRLKERVAELERQSEESRQAQEAAQLQLDAAREEHHQSVAQLREEHAAVLSAKQQQLETQSKAAEEARQRVVSLEALAAMFQQEKQALIAEVETHMQQSTQARNRLAEMDERVRRVDTNAEERLRHAEEQTSTLRLQLQEEQTRREELSVKVQRLQDAVFEADRERDRLQLRLADQSAESGRSGERETAQLAEAEARHATDQQRLQEMIVLQRNELADRDQELARLREQLRAQELTSNEAADAITAAASQRQLLDRDLNNMAAECQRLSSELEAAHHELTEERARTDYYMAQFEAILRNLKDRTPPPFTMDVEADGGKNVTSVHHSSVDPTQFPLLLQQYYLRLFPYGKYFKWLSYGGVDKKEFENREFSFTLKDDVYVRYQSFADMSELKEGRVVLISTLAGIVPEQEKPKDHKKIKSSEFYPVAKELVFDIDMTDYDEIRTCCSGAAICHKCWGFMTAAVKVLDAALREDFGFQHLLWVYSGRRGIHCWVCDKRARLLSQEARGAVAEYLQLVRGGDQTAKKVSLTSPLHPCAERACRILEPYFREVVLSSDSQVRQAVSLHPIPRQLHLFVDARMSVKLTCLGSASSAQALLAHSEHCNTMLSILGMDAIEADIKVNRSVTMSFEPSSLQLIVRCRCTTGCLGSEWAQRRQGQKSKKVSRTQELMLQYIYPRLDINVSKGTGRVCVPIDPSKADEFDPFAVPTIDRLCRELDEFEEEQQLNAYTEAGEPSPKRKIQNFNKTSLSGAMKIFTDFLQGLDEENAELAEDAGVKSEAMEW